MGGKSRKSGGVSRTLIERLTGKKLSKTGNLKGKKKDAKSFSIFDEDVPRTDGTKRD